MSESIFEKPNKINVLFLDLDGVINNTTDDLYSFKFMGYDTGDKFSIKLVHNLNTLIKHYDLKIVLSSSWRKLYDIISMREIFIQMGIEGELIDYTTKEYMDKTYYKDLEYDKSRIPKDRGMQISHWLDERKYNIDKYLVIDDDIDAKFGHENNFIKTNVKVGFDDITLKETIEKFDPYFWGMV